MHTDQIYIARDGKSGMHVLVRILAVDDIGKDYLPIDPDDFNKLMMARDVRSLVLAARDLGPMYISADILSRRIFIPSHLQQHIEHGVNLVPSDLESLLSECYFDPYAIPVETNDMGYRAIGRTGKKSTRELIDEIDFTKAGDLSYLDSQFRAIVEPLHDWVFARNLLSILMRIGGLYRSGADPDTILEAARFRQVNSMVLKKRFDIDTGTCYAIPIEFRVSHPKAIEDVRKYATVDFPVMEISITDDIANAGDTRKSLAERITGTGHATRFAGREWLYSPAAKKILKRSWHIEAEPSDKPLRHKGTDLVRLETPLPAITIYAVKGAPTGETSWDNIDLTLREISEATVEKQEEALRKKRSLSSRCPSYKNSAPAGRQIKQTEDTGFETPTKPHGILGRLKGLFGKFRK